MNDPIPLTGCQPCFYWTSKGCLKAKPGYPGIGNACRGYEREAGVDG